MSSSGGPRQRWQPEPPTGGTRLEGRAMSGDRLPTYFLSHGGGPWSYMDGPGRQGYAKLEQSLVDMRPELKSRVRAILMISGHWEESGFAISSADHPGMVYDYGGFPDYLYRIRYAAP